MNFFDNLKYYRMLFSNKNGLNPRLSVLCKLIDQEARRLFFAFPSPLRKKLYLERMYLAAPDQITEEQRKRLGEIAWTLGEMRYSIYVFNEEEQERGRQVVREIIEELKAERKW